MGKTINLPKLICQKCGHEWVPRQDEVRQCPNCKSVWWDQPKIKEYEVEK